LPPPVAGHRLDRGGVLTGSTVALLDQVEGVTAFMLAADGQLVFI
jgi:hypothetical protein